VDIEGTTFNSRIQGGILCDGLGSFVSALATGPPMVSQAGNNGVIVLTSCAVSKLPPVLPHMSANSNLRAAVLDGQLQ
jgi:xanthine/uracil permease